MTSESNIAPIKAAPVQNLDHKTIMEHLSDIPQVRGYRVLLIPVHHEQKTSGGIVLPDDVVAKQRNHAQVFRVVGLGSDAYKDTDRFPTGPFCEMGDYVLLGRYAGTKITTTYCDDLRAVNDDEIIAVVTDLNRSMDLV